MIKLIKTFEGLNTEHILVPPKPRRMITIEEFNKLLEDSPKP